jgi:hypothetical protein
VNENERCDGRAAVEDQRHVGHHEANFGLAMGLRKIFWILHKKEELYSYARKKCALNMRRMSEKAL